MQFKHSNPVELLENVGDDRETFLQLATIFRTESVAIFGRMRDAAAKGDLLELGRESHSLKGTVGPLGANQLMQMLLDIEDECKSGNCVCDTARLAGVEDELKMVALELANFIDQF
jgi:HPt (histidine-containing phosphotransfer) domain-containing protein